MKKLRTDVPVLLLHNVDDDWEAADVEDAEREATLLEEALRALGHPVENVPVRTPAVKECLQPFDPSRYVVFNWVEGLQGVVRGDVIAARALAELGFAYTGSTADVIELAWEKPRVKRLMVKRGIPTPKWLLAESAHVAAWDAFPAIVKPAEEHCSIGVDRDSVVLTLDELRARVHLVVTKYHQPALVEEFIDGREFHVAVWGNDRSLKMLPPAEMDFSAFTDVHDHLCTFDSKFCPGTAHYERIEMRIPAELTPLEHATLEKTAFATFRAFHCRDYARLDVRLRDGVFYVVDVNPNPDIRTETSIHFAAEKAGFAFGELGSRLVGLAARRHAVFARPQ